MPIPLDVLLQYLAPQQLLSRFAGFVAKLQHPTALKNWIIQRFIQRYQVDMSLALYEDPKSYPDFQSFFTRALKPEARPITHSPNTLICPVDGTVSQAGRIEQGRIFQAKGFHFTLNELLGQTDSNEARAFTSGQFATFYLSPKDYHCVHLPMTAVLKTMRYIPGRLFSVNPSTVNHVPNLFARNERVVCHFENERGIQMILVFVGAMIVGSISTTWHGLVTQRKGKRTPWEQQYPIDHSKSPMRLSQGDKVGHFCLGSTVLLLTDSHSADWSSDLTANQTVQMGQNLGPVISVTK